MHWKRWLGITILLAALVAALIYGFRPQPLLVETAEARRGPLRVTVEEEGKTRVTDRYVVSAPISGYTRRITLKAGHTVGQGQALVEIEPPRSTVLDPRTRAQAEAQVATAEAALAAAQERVRAAEADARYWTAELARVEKLLKTGDVPRDRYDRAVAEERRSAAAQREAEERVRVAKAEIKTAQVALEYSAVGHTAGRPDVVTVRAAVSGRVLRVVRESEGAVQAGEPLIEIGNARSLEVEVELLSADAVKVGPGTRVIFTRWGGETPLEGRVRTVEPVGFTKTSALGVEEQRVPVIADITSPPELWRRLGAGYRVDAGFVLWEEENVLQVPSSALLRYQDGWAVFTIENGIARRRKVEIGRRTGLMTQVLSGVAEGTAVITHPDTAIEDGTLVALRQPPGS